jgi:transcriptional regulator with XRE-family HTH domain
MRMAIELDGRDGARGGTRGVPDLLVGLRTDVGLTQSALADRLGSHQPVISRWESGADEPRLSTLARIARACGHDVILSVEPHGVDQTQIRELRRLTPRARLDLLAEDAAGLDRLLRAARR